jgi:hypothetical protein
VESSSDDRGHDLNNFVPTFPGVDVSRKNWRPSGKTESIFNNRRHGLKHFIPTFDCSIQSEKLAVPCEKSAPTFGSSRQNFQLLAERISQRAEPVRLQAGGREHRY